MSRRAASKSAALAPEPPLVSLETMLCEQVRALLKQQGWSQRAFAARLGVTQGAVSLLLTAKRRTSALTFYERVAEVFGVSLSGLIADLERHRLVGVSLSGRIADLETHRQLGSELAGIIRIERTEEESVIRVTEEPRPRASSAEQGDRSHGTARALPSNTRSLEESIREHLDRLIEQMAHQFALRIWSEYERILFRAGYHTDARETTPPVLSTRGVEPRDQSAPGAAAARPRKGRRASPRDRRVS